MAEPVTTLTPEQAAVLEAIVGQAPGGELLTAGLSVAAAPPPPATIETLPPEVSFLTKNIQPPAPLYLSREDAVRVRVWNSLTGQTLQVRLRVLTPQGELIPTAFDLAPTDDRVLNDTEIQLGEGFLMGAAITLTGPRTLRGQTFVRIDLIRGTGLLAIDWASLLGDYVHSGHQAAWPYAPVLSPLDGAGFLRSVVGTDPAAGVEISETVLLRVRWRLQSLHAVLVTSAAVATRIARLAVDDSVNISTLVEAPTSQLASLTRRYTWMAGGGYAQAALDITNLAGLPVPTALLAGWRVRTSTVNLQAGDDWSAPVYVVEEWIEP